jgi:flagellin
LIRGGFAQRGKLKMTSINTNTASVLASNALVRNERAMSTSMERLSTGLRINSAKDDAAGLAIAKKMSAQVSGLKVAARNANDAISMLQTYEGALREMTDMMQRMRDLTLQANSTGLTTTDIANLGDEYNALGAEIRRVVEDTEWNTDADLDGGASHVVQIGANASQTIAITIADFTDATDANAGGAVMNLVGDSSTPVTWSAANNAAVVTQLGLLDLAIDDVTDQRASYGAYISRLEHTVDNLLNVAANTDASRGRIEDADYATETTNLARTQIIAQAGTAMLAQANQIKQTVLALLK